MPHITTVNIVLCVLTKQLVLALSGMLCSVRVPEEQRPQLNVAETWIHASEKLLQWWRLPLSVLYYLLNKLKNWTVLSIIIFLWTKHKMIVCVCVSEEIQHCVVVQTVVLQDMSFCCYSCQHGEWNFCQWSWRSGYGYFTDSFKPHWTG
jgi:hypothetical protein